MKELSKIPNTSSTKNVFPSPTEKEMESAEFKAIFNLIKRWDIGIAEQGGYQHGNGSHVKLILDTLKPFKRKDTIDDFLKTDIICEHEFISKEFPSQTYGTCMNCGITLINLI